MSAPINLATSKEHLMYGTIQSEELGFWTFSPEACISAWTNQFLFCTCLFFVHPPLQVVHLDCKVMRRQHLGTFDTPQSQIACPPPARHEAS